MDVEEIDRAGPAEIRSADASTPDQAHFLSGIGPQKSATVSFETLFLLDEIQRIQDEFSLATGVASIITRPDGTPLTGPSHFTKLCSEIIRQTEQGCANCYKSDATIGRYNPSGPVIQPCMSGGLWDAGASIAIDGNHVANWLIGQVRDETQTDEKMRAYANSIGAEESAFMEAFDAVPAMSRERFEHIAKALFTLANQLSTKAFLNVQQQQVIAELQVVQKNLQDSETYNKTLFADSCIALVVMDPGTGTFVDCNEAAWQIYRLPGRDAVIGLTPLDVSAPRQHDGSESVVAIRRHVDQVLARGSEVFEWRHRRLDGQDWDAEVHLMSFELGGRTLLQFSLQDITDRKLADEARRISENQFREFFDEAPIGYHQFDAEGRITRVNRTELASLGYSEEEMLGRYVWEFNDSKTLSHQAVLEKLAGTSIPTTSFERNFCRKDGTKIPMLIQDKILRNKTGEITGIRSVVMDITERKQAEEKINRLAFFDQLTGLPNRTLLQDRLRQAMASSLRSGSYGALLLIDLDYFKTLNDTLGHDMGDLLLKQVARRLSESVREEDTVARQGGDEFVVMLVHLSESPNEAASLVELIGGKINAALNLPYVLKEVSYSITPSIGASVFQGQQTAIDTLLKQADLAMYEAKNAGRNTLRFFDPEMARDVLKRASLDNDLREALQEKQYVLHYQAQMTGNQVTGAEALLRWQHPLRGLVLPGEFISLIEESGLILPVGQWVLEAACKQLANWATQPEMSQLTVAVNISARQLNQEDFVDQVLVALDRSGADPGRLKLELTESLLVNNVEDIIDKMTALKSKGVGFSLDDFGTGYSSLAYLKRLPLDQLKIDQGFVRDILTDPNDAAIARMIVVLAESLGLAVIAEGVESEAQRDFLAQHGCQAYQGYFFNRPVPQDEFELFVKQRQAGSRSAASL